MRKPNGGKVLLPETSTMFGYTYTRSVYINTDSNEEYRGEWNPEFNPIFATHIDNLEIESGDDIVIIIDLVDLPIIDGIERTSLFLFKANKRGKNIIFNNVTRPNYIISNLNKTHFTISDLRYDFVQSIANIFRQMELNDITLYFYIKE